MLTSAVRVPTVLVGVVRHVHERGLLPPLPLEAAHARGDAHEHAEGQDPDHHAGQDDTHLRCPVAAASALAAATLVTAAAVLRSRWRQGVP